MLLNCSRIENLYFYSIGKFNAAFDAKKGVNFLSVSVSHWKLNHHLVAVEIKGRIYAIAGHDGNLRLSTVEMYDSPFYDTDGDGLVNETEPNGTI